MGGRLFFELDCFLKWRLESPHHGQYNDDQQDKAQAAARVIAPSAAVRPRRQRADQKQYQDHDQDSAHFLPSVSSLGNRPFSKLGHVP